ncbi:hypothetical protein X759_30475 [Mesorhizobium sp. LSHC420B00]|nr:hypothetical protein X759_30475 [Mesorhizobium sp. LSHC420B00]
MAAPTSAVWPGIHIPSSADVAVTVQSKAMAVALAKHFKFEFMLTVALILPPVLRRLDW